MKKLIAILSVVLFANQASADDVELASQAFQRGDYNEAQDLWQSLADKGNLDAMRNIGFLHYQGLGVSQNYSLAAEWYEKAASAGHPAAQIDLAFMYLNALGVEKNEAKGLQLYKLASDQGHPLGMHNLGELYYGGKLVERNISMAFDLFERAHALGEVRSTYNLALMYYNGEGTNKDLQKSVSLFTSAADREIVLAQYNLYVILADNGVAAPNGQYDNSKAFEWLKLAANNNFLQAQHDLGLWYFDGKFGSNQNQLRGYGWLFLATDNGYLKGKALMQEAAKRLPVEKVLKAQKVARECKPQEDKYRCMLKLRD